ncbi:glycosyltransferase 61 family protein [Methylocystis sp. JAN1]|uniref:glycosyltransferase 61 family protein n=1 Tax=Methylocystis sp. JAN1 TaxID=3397211 RepID=UPI003FA2184B
MAPSLKPVSELGLSEANSLDEVAERSDSIFREGGEPAVVGETTAFEINAEGQFVEKREGVGYAPPSRFYASLNDVFYHPFCNIVTRGDEIVLEDTIAERGRSFDEWPLNHLQLRRIRAPELRASLPRHREPVILGGHSSFCIFGHFFLDMLPLIVRFRSLLNGGELKIGFFQFKDWMRDLFELADVDLACVKMLDAMPNWLAHGIISHHHSAKTTQYPCANAEISYGFLRERVDDGHFFERVFFLRGDAVRRLQNEAEVAMHFASRGFVILDPQKFSVAGQAEIMKSAKVFASVFGSGFSLCPLMEPGVGTVIELAPSTIRDHWLRRLLARFDLKHVSIVYDGETQFIDIAVLSAILDRVLD